MYTRTASNHTFCAALLLLAFCLGGAAPSEARGKGPIGLWPVDERYVVLADSSLPGLVLVDLLHGRAVERLEMNNGRPIGVAGCANCDYLLVTGGDGLYWKLPLAAPAAELLQKNGRLGLRKSKLVPLAFTGPKDAPLDARLTLMSEDGSTAYVAASRDNTVYRIDLAQDNHLSAVFKDPGHEPFGLNWDRDGHLLVTMHRREVWRIDTAGKPLGKYDIHKADCPGARRFDPILRAALDDPTAEDELFILATNPRSYDAVIWRYHIAERPSCTIVAGSIGRDSGWVDGSGTDVQFSRPHYFSPRPGVHPPQIVISDIDNRALRLLHLDTMSTSTVMYDRDRRLQIMQGGTPAATRRCSDRDKTDWPRYSRDKTTDRGAFCHEPTGKSVQLMDLAAAENYCAAQGARLCEPAQWQAMPPLADAAAWTSAKCASCWMKKRKALCPAVIDNYRTPGGVHKDKDFEHRWHSGQALLSNRSATGEMRLECVAKEAAVKAAVVCCADQAD